MGVNVGVQSVAAGVADGCVGVSGKARSISAIYVGDENGKAQPAYMYNYDALISVDTVIMSYSGLFLKSGQDISVSENEWWVLADAPRNRFFAVQKTDPQTATATKIMTKSASGTAWTVLPDIPSGKFGNIKSKPSIDPVDGSILASVIEPSTRVVFYHASYDVTNASWTWGLISWNLTDVKSVSSLVRYGNIWYGTIEREFWYQPSSGDSYLRHVVSYVCIETFSDMGSVAGRYSYPQYPDMRSSYMQGTGYMLGDDNFALYPLIFKTKGFYSFFSLYKKSTSDLYWLTASRTTDPTFSTGIGGVMYNVCSFDTNALAPIAIDYEHSRFWVLAIPPTSGTPSETPAYASGKAYCIQAYVTSSGDYSFSVTSCGDMMYFLREFGSLSDCCVSGEFIYLLSEEQPRLFYSYVGSFLPMTTKYLSGIPVADAGSIAFMKRRTM